MQTRWDDTRIAVRTMILDGNGLVRAVAAGKRRGAPSIWRRVEIRPVDLAAGRRLQIVRYDERQAHTSNYDIDSAPSAVDELLDQGFGNWHVETLTETLQVRITKKGDALTHRSAHVEPLVQIANEHDRVKQRLFDVSHPDVRAFLTAVGVADREGQIKPTRRDKYRQVEEFVRLLDTAIEDAVAAGSLAPAMVENPWRVVDLGCGHAYLTVGAYVWLSRIRGIPVRVHGVDVRADSLLRNEALAQTLGWAAGLTFEAATITESTAAGADVVIALHACDTATDDALARAVTWRAPVILVAPCCQHDLQVQVKKSAPEPYGLIARHGLLRERFIDILTDSVRMSILRIVGYRVDAVEFVNGEHTPRNLMVRAVRTDASPTRTDLAEYDEMTAQWNVKPALAQRLAGELHRIRSKSIPS